MSSLTISSLTISLVWPYIFWQYLVGQYLVWSPANLSSSIWPSHHPIVCSIMATSLVTLAVLVAANVCPVRACVHAMLIYIVGKFNYLLAVFLFLVAHPEIHELWLPLSHVLEGTVKTRKYQHPSNKPALHIWAGIIPIWMSILFFLRYNYQFESIDLSPSSFGEISKLFLLDLFY